MCGRVASIGVLGNEPGQILPGSAAGGKAPNAVASRFADAHGIGVHVEHQPLKADCQRIDPERDGVGGLPLIAGMEIDDAGLFRDQPAAGFQVGVAFVAGGG